MSLSLQNKSKLPVTVILSRGLHHDHPDCAPSVQSFSRSVTFDDGTVGVRVEARHLPGSLTWQPGETRSELPDTLLQEPEVKRAIFSKVLVCIRT